MVVAVVVVVVIAASAAVVTVVVVPIHQLRPLFAVMPRRWVIGVCGAHQRNSGAGVSGSGGLGFWGACFGCRVSGSCKFQLYEQGKLVYCTQRSCFGL